jgi:uncharacterized protein (DUF2237 family)
MKPLTGFFRDGCCNTSREDIGNHTVCAIMTAEFLEFSKSGGNDLSTPMPQFGFPGLRPGDRWCLCAPRWQEALAGPGAPRGFAGYARSLPRPLRARRSEAVRGGPRLTQTPSAPTAVSVWIDRADQRPDRTVRVAQRLLA